MNTPNWFEVDRAGLAKLLERRGKEFALFEVISNDALCRLGARLTELALTMPELFKRGVGT